MPKYGPGVVDPEIYEKEKKAETGGRAKYGPAVLDSHPAGESEAPVKTVETVKVTAADEDDVEDAEEELEKAAGDDGHVNIAEFTKALGDDVEKIPAFLETELNREEGPRKGALKVLRKLEESQEEGDVRPDILEIIDDALEDFEG